MQRHVGLPPLRVVAQEVIVHTGEPLLGDRCGGVRSVAETHPHGHAPSGRRLRHPTFSQRITRVPHLPLALGERERPAPVLQEHRHRPELREVAEFPLPLPLVLDERHRLPGEHGRALRHVRNLGRCHRNLSSAHVGDQLAAQRRVVGRARHGDEQESESHQRKQNDDGSHGGPHWGRLARKRT